MITSMAKTRKTRRWPASHSIHCCSRSCCSCRSCRSHIQGTYQTKQGLVHAGTSAATRMLFFEKAPQARPNYACILLLSAAVHGQLKPKFLWKLDISNYLSCAAEAVTGNTMCSSLQCKQGTLQHRSSETAVWSKEHPALPGFCIGTCFCCCKACLILHIFRKTVCLLTSFTTPLDKVMANIILGQIAGCAESGMGAKCPHPTAPALYTNTHCQALTIT